MAKTFQYLDMPYAKMFLALWRKINSLLQIDRKRYERLMKRMLTLVLPSVIVRICTGFGSYYCTSWYKMSTPFASMVFENPLCRIHLMLFRPFNMLVQGVIV